MELKTVSTLKSLLLCFVLLSFVTSCKKEDEDDCVLPALSLQIVGEWQADVSGFGKIPLTFTSGGVIEGNLAQYLEQLSLLGNIDDRILYQVTSDAAMNIIVTEGDEQTTFSLNVQERTCEKIVLSTTGVVITLTD